MMSEIKPATDAEIQPLDDGEIEALTGALWLNPESEYDDMLLARAFARIRQDTARIDDLRETLNDDIEGYELLVERWQTLAEQFAARSTHSGDCPAWPEVEGTHPRCGCGLRDACIVLAEIKAEFE